MKKLLVLLLLTLPLAGRAKEMSQIDARYIVFDLSFEGPAGMDKTDISAHPGEIFEFTLLTGTAPDDSVIHVDFYLFPATALKDLGGIKGLMQYGKSTILATVKPAAQYIKRKILGKRVKGEILNIKIPVPSYAEAYVIPVPGSKQFLFLGIKAEEGAPQIVTEDLIRQITSTLKKP